jgi:hypothetical protein
LAEILERDEAEVLALEIKWSRDRDERHRLAGELVASSLALRVRADVLRDALSRARRLYELGIAIGHARELGHVEVANALGVQAEGILAVIGCALGEAIDE